MGRDRLCGAPEGLAGGAPHAPLVQIRALLLCLCILSMDRLCCQADSESVCDWTVPAGSIKMDSVVSSESWVYTVGLLGAIAAIGIGGYYAQAYLSAEATA